jgi:CelD/BcsL family acetyltransferase involved in cellulose biosynthesis
VSGKDFAELCDPTALDTPLVDAWRALAEVRENPFLTPEWFAAWHATYPAEEPFVVLWRRDGELRGVLPLVRVASGPIHVLRFAGARRGDWFTPVCRPEDELAMAAACAELLAHERRRWQLIELDRVDRASTWPQALWDAAGGIAAARPRRTDVLPCIHFGDGGYDDYLAARSRNFRSQLGRRRRKLERDHGLEFRLTISPDDLGEDLDVFFRLHDERWRERGGSSSATDDARDLQRRFAAAALERGWLRLWTADADGAPAAAWYGWRIGDRYCYALSGLGDGWERLGLGTVMLAHTIEQAAVEGATVYDMMWGDEGYKARFETARREAASWVLGRRRHPVALAAAARTVAESQARALRDRRAARAEEAGD